MSARLWFKNRGFTYAEVYPMMEKVWFQSLEFTNFLEGIKNQELKAEFLPLIDYDQQRLLETLQKIKPLIPVTTVHVPFSPIWAELRSITYAPIITYDRFNGEAISFLQRDAELYREDLEALQKMPKTLLELPGDIISGTLDQLQKALKLPTWFVPTTLGLAVMGGLYLVYSKFERSLR